MQRKPVKCEEVYKKVGFQLHKLIITKYRAHNRDTSEIYKLDINYLPDRKYIVDLSVEK